MSLLGFVSTLSAIGMTAPPIPLDIAPATEILPFPSVTDDTDAETETELLIEAATDRYARMTVPVLIGESGPYRFMIDTGAQATVVTRGLTDRLDLAAAGSATIVGMGSMRPVSLVWVHGLEFAGRTLDNIRAPLLEARNVGADGILGLDSLQDMRVLIDFRTNTIAVNEAEELGGNEGYEIVVRARSKLGRLIIASTRIDGVRTALIIDTGSQGSFGNASLKRRLRARKLGDMISRDVNGVEMTGEMQAAKALQIGRLQLNDVPITFADSPVFGILGLEKRPALILGMRNLRLFDRVAIDFASRRILFDVPANAGFQRQRRDPFPPTP